MEHNTEYEKAPSTLVSALREQLHLTTEQRENTGSFATLQAAFADVDWHKRAEAVLAAGAYPEHVSTELLLVALHDEDVSVRAAAVHVWGKRKEGVPLVRLVDALHDTEWLVREAAVLALGSLDEPAIAQDHLLIALNDESVFVQEAARSVLTSLASPTVNESHASLPVGFIVQVINSFKRRIMGVIHLGDNEMRQNTSDFYDKDSPVTIIDLDPLEPTTPARPTLPGRGARLSRLAVGGLAMLVVLAIIASWLLLLPRLYSSRSAYSTNPPGTILFKMPSLANSNGYYLPAWTNDNKYLSFVDAKGNAYVWDSITGRVKKTITLHYPTIDPDPYVTWSRLPGGKYITSVASTHLETDTLPLPQLWNVLTGQEQTFLPANAGYYGQYSGWSNDGTLVAFIDKQNDLEIWNADKQTRLLKISSAHFSNVIDTTWSSDDRRLAISSSDGFIQVLDTKTGAVLHSFTLPLQKEQLLSSNPYGGFWSSDLSLVMILFNFKNVGQNIPIPVQVWNVATGQENYGYSADEVSTALQWWFNDGKRVLTLAANEARVWDASTGQTLFTFPSSLTLNSGVPVQPLSPDNKLFLYTDGKATLYIRDARSGREIYTYQGARANILPGSVTWSSDSTSVAFVDEDGVLHVLNARTGASEIRFTFNYIVANQFPFVTTAWSPNSKMLALTTEQNTAVVLQAP